MTLKNLIIPITFTAIIFLSGCQKKPVNLIQYVNPLIGTGPSSGPESLEKNQGPEKWGLAIPAVSTPFGMTQWTPQTREGEKKGVSPYYYGGQRIHGFRGTHWLGGSQTSDYGSFTIMPITGYLKTFASERASGYTHDNETSTPAYYSTMLLNYMTLVEITSTTRAGFFKFSYGENSPATILITPNSNEGKGYIKIDPDKNEIYGYNPVSRINQDSISPAGFNGYFVVRFIRPFDKYGCYYQMEDLKNQLEIFGKPDIGAYATFNAKKDEAILAKVGTSFTGIEEARANLDAEIPHWDFNKTRSETEQIWNEALSNIQLEGGKKDDYNTFYTSLYRALLFPRTFSDADGSYPAFAADKPKQKMESGLVYYDDFLMTEEQQAQLSLVRLVAPNRYDDLLTSSKLKAKQGGWMMETYLKNKSILDEYSLITDPVERQKRVKQIMKTEYNRFDGGIPGNDNAGQKSAWYVWSAMGLYPSANDEYQLTSPIFGKVQVNLNPKYYSGKTLKIILDDDTDTYKTFGKVELNGNENQFVIRHEDLQKGAKLEYSDSK